MGGPVHPDRRVAGLDGPDLRPSVSMGVSVYPEDGVDPGTPLRQAEVAMGRAKPAEAIPQLLLRDASYAGPRS